MTHQPQPIPADNLVDFDHAYRTGGTLTHDTPTITTNSDVTYHEVIPVPVDRPHATAEWLGRRLGEATVYGLLVVGAWTILKWVATAIVAMDAHEDCVRLSRQADYGYIDQAVVPKYCDALLHP